MQIRLMAIAIASFALYAGTDQGCPTQQEDCPRPESPEDGLRRVVVSHPYDAAGRPASTYEVLELSSSGVLSRPGITFRMGRATEGKIVFTPDGKIGMLAQEDGTLGVFRFESDGQPVVVHSAFEGSFYATSVLMDPSGQRAWILDSNWRENGGGIYSVHIYCDGTLEDEGLQAPSKLAYAMAYLPDDSGAALLAADDVLTSRPGQDAHLVTLGDEVTWQGGVDAFGDDDAIVSSATVTWDSAYGLVADNSFFSETGNRIGVIDIENVSATQVLNNIEDPMDVIASPFDNAVLVVSGYGDALFLLNYQPNMTPPFSLTGQVSYSGARPQLPSKAVMINRGALTGLVLVSENVGVRQVQFEPDGTVTDLGLESFGSGYENIAGAIGVQP